MILWGARLYVLRLHYVIHLTEREVIYIKKRKGERKGNMAKITESKRFFFLHDTSHFTEKEGKLIYQICKPWRALSPWTLKKQPAVSMVDIFPWLTNATKAASRQVFNVTLSCSPTRWRRYDRPEFKHLLQVTSSESVVAQLLVTSLKFGDCNISRMVVIPTHW